MGETLWAPWRIEYILGKKTEGCFLCTYPDEPARFAENHVLTVRPHAFVCLNKYPFAAGHILVAPRRHVAALEELTGEEHIALFDLLRDSVVRMKRATNPQGLNVGFNLGKAAGAGVDEHLHGHIVPRWAGDSNFMPVIGDTRVMPEYLHDTYNRLLPFWAEDTGTTQKEPA
jgi:ATP adenylyltransferase